MKAIAFILSVVALALSVVPSFLVFYGVIPWERHAQLMIAGMVLWFVTAPFWMKTKPSVGA